MDIPTKDLSPATIARRIDAIIAELQALKQQMQAAQPSPTPPPNLVEELAGALGNGHWAEYDQSVEWERFDR
jgi:hypothetical protein